MWAYRAHLTRFRWHLLALGSCHPFHSAFGARFSDFSFQFSAFSNQLSVSRAQQPLTSLTASFFTHGNTLEHFKLQLMRLQNIIVGI